MGGLFCFFVLSVVALLLSWKDWGLNVVAGIKGEFFVHCSFWAFLLFDLIDVLVFTTSMIMLCLLVLRM
jgi:hypothetical protein